MSDIPAPPQPVGTADPLARITSDPLRRAAAQVLAGLRPDGAADRLAERLSSLALVVEAAREPAPDPADGGGEPGDAADERLLELLLEAELAQRCQGGGAPSHTELLGVLRSFGEARRSLRPPADDALSPPFEHPSVVVGLAHDLRSPLTSVLFLSDALRSGYSGELNDTQRRQLGIVYTAALGLVSMANDILDLYRRRGDRLVDEQPSSFSLGEIAASIRDIVLPIAEERRIDLRFSLAGDDRRMGHPVALARVLLNLVVNALKYTEAGFVELAARPAGGSRTEFSVRDSGSGIRPEEEATLFQPVRPVSRWNGPGFSGSGLGLALARHLVREMGSDLAYETAAGAGTRFFFELDLPAAPPA
ncbi:MAG TPA: HAMP domain-containing sensor histidine kinase [Longimicrobiaceae bacterium]|nr:HAMP domain-containing sensor histidine kinase [Longimicrobiaceae bacterium]